MFIDCPNAKLGVRGDNFNAETLLSFFRKDLSGFCINYSPGHLHTDCAGSHIQMGKYYFKQPVFNLKNPFCLNSNYDTTHHKLHLPRTNPVE